MDQSRLKSDQELYDELACYTLAHGDPSFIHQYIVDAYAAQHADEKTKPIGLTFALVGLYLHIARHYSGKEVRRAHMQLAKEKKQWPLFELPKERGSMSVGDVMAAQPGTDRDNAIREWSASVWKAWSACHARVAEMVRSELGQRANHDKGQVPFVLPAGSASRWSSRYPNAASRRIKKEPTENSMAPLPSERHLSRVATRRKAMG